MKTEPKVLAFLRGMKEDILSSAAKDGGMVRFPQHFAHVVAGMVGKKMYVLAKSHEMESAVIKEIRPTGSMHKIPVNDEVIVIKALTGLLSRYTEALHGVILRNSQMIIDQFESMPEFYLDLEGFTAYGLTKGVSKQLMLLPMVDEDNKVIPDRILCATKLLKGGLKKFPVPEGTLEYIQAEFMDTFGLNPQETVEAAPTTAPPVVENKAKGPAKLPADMDCPIRGSKIKKKVCLKQSSDYPQGCQDKSCSLFVLTKVATKPKAGEGAVKQKEAVHPHSDGDDEGFVQQFGYTGMLAGRVEMLPANIYINKIQCANKGCENVRYLKNSDLFQCEFCKPCTMKARRQRRAKSKAARKSAAEAK